jgi:phosphoribosylformylglycinamidine synthase
LGLLPHGEIRLAEPGHMTFAPNNIGRHVSQISRVRVSSNRSPWLQAVKVGEVYSVPISTGCGKFVCTKEELQNLIDNGQIATQYVDLADNATMLSPYNPSGSMMAVEGLISTCGKIFGKMGNADRVGTNLYKNVPGNYDMQIFKSGVRYFK